MISSKFPLEKRFEEFLVEHRLVQKGDSLLLAISGGIDSMVMLSLFDSIRRTWDLRLGVIHVNHQLRGEESTADEEFVRAAASAHNFPLYSMRIDAAGYAKEHRCSLQEAARELRYSFFERSRQDSGARAVATGHQANDNAETVLLNAARGAGVRGLSGIPLRRDQGNVIRPLLFAYRSELEAYAREAGIGHREDSSNASLKYARNVVRLRVIPALERETRSSVPESLNRVSEIMRSLGSKIEQEIREKEDELISRGDSGNLRIFIPRLRQEPPYLQEEFILHVFRHLGIEPSAEKVLNIIGLCSQQTGRSLRLSSEISVYRDRDRLMFGKPVMEEEFALPVEIGGNYHVGEFRFSLEKTKQVPKVFGKKEHTEFVDAEHLGERLVLRSWKAGDRFVPLGMKAKKKLSDFFTDQKIPLIEKSRTPVLESDGEIVWVCGKRLDDRFKVTASTRTAIKLTFTPMQAQ